MIKKGHKKFCRIKDKTIGQTLLQQRNKRETLKHIKLPPSQCPICRGVRGLAPLLLFEPPASCFWLTPEWVGLTP